jgi:hypothetical protein
MLFVYAVGLSCILASASAYGAVTRPAMQEAGICCQHKEFAWTLKSKKSHINIRNGNHIFKPAVVMLITSNETGNMYEVKNSC